MTFSSASIWNRYSFPARRAGSPLHVSCVPSTANGTSAWRSSWAMARTTRRLRSSNAPAQPTQYRIGRVAPAHAVDGAPRPLVARRVVARASGPGRRPTRPGPCPVQPSRLRLAPRVPGVLHVAEGGVQLGREGRLLQHQVAANLHDRVDVLDEDRAALDAPAAGGALPDRLLRDGVVDQRQRSARRPRARGPGREPHPRPPPRRWRRPSLRAGAEAAAASAVSAITIWSRSPSMKCFGLSVLPVIWPGRTPCSGRTRCRTGLQQVAPCQVL